jgi:GT2 family glycosyltransferase/glycosyltransferase involved in cell wall biosynthesis
MAKFALTAPQLMAPTQSASLAALTEKLVAAETETHLCRLLGQIAGAVRSGDLDTAYRYSDRAARLAPAEPEIALLCGRLLLARGDAALAVDRLARAARLQADPEPAAWHVIALREAGLWQAAREQLEAALRRFPVVEGGTLAAVAQAATTTDPSDGPGWAGLTPTLEIIGEARGIGFERRLSCFATDGTPLVSHPLRPGGAETVLFRLPLPGPTVRGAVSIQVDGAALLGSGLMLPPEFALDGRAMIDGQLISGWASVAWLRRPPDTLTIEDDQGRRATMGLSADQSDPAIGRFTVDTTMLGLGGDRFVISAVLPDGHTQALPDGPLLRRPGPVPRSVRSSRRPLRSAVRRRTTPPRALIDVIVPVYLGREETLACLGAVIETTAGRATIVVVDDASPDQELAVALADLAAAGSITLLRNETNQGFPGSVNRALELHPGSDAVLLNADALPFGDWLWRLQAVAYSAANIGTVTPLSNTGSIVSYPAGDGADLSDAETAALDSLAAGIDPGIPLELPTGVGFCLYLRHDCLEETGLFDAATFAAGYGEENDFCLRARRRDWRHVLAANVYVRHLGNRSFGSRRAALTERNQRLLGLRYPDYEKIVERFIAADLVGAVRRRLDEERLVASAGDVVLLVTLQLPGGVERFVRERCARLRAQGLRPLVIQPGASSPAVCCTLGDHTDAYRDLRYDLPDDLASFRALLARLRVVGVELHHFLGHDPCAIEAVLWLGVPHDAFIHDYSWVCPRLSLLGGEGKFCGEPDLPACEACARKHGASVAEPATVAELRSRNEIWLRSARTIIAPTADTAARLCRYFPALRPRVEPWEVDIIPAVPPIAATSPPVRVAILGAIGKQKGYEVLLACAQDAMRRTLPIEFSVIGFTEDDDALFATGKVFVTGVYEESEIDDLLRREAPHLALFPSVTPETWCYTLSHALRAGIPIIAFDLGAIAERLCGVDRSRVVPLSTSPASLNDAMLAMADKGDVRDEAEEAMAAPTLEQSAPLEDQSAEISNQALSAAAHPITVGPGLYLFRVRSSMPTASAGTADIALPAVNLTVVPGGSADNVEFMSAPGGNGSWLCRPSDMVVARVAERASTLLLTSLRAPGGPMLSIEVERLDKHEIPTAPPAAVAEADDTNPSTPTGEPPSPPGLRAELSVHVQRRGDRLFTTPAWAGFRGEGIWIESFSINPLELIGADQIEYKGLTATGYETPWLSNGAPCGTRGNSMPLLGFAVRLKPSSDSQHYDCEYGGAFLSGATVGPCRNGAPCVSMQSDDPLEAIQLRIVEHLDVVGPPPVQRSTDNRPRPRRHAGRNGKSGQVTPVAPVATEREAAPAVA